MKATAIKAYFPDNEFNCYLIFECIYLLENKDKALQFCKEEHPELMDPKIILDAKPYDPENLKNKEHYRKCIKINQVRFFN